MVVSLSDRLYAISSMMGMAKLRPGKAVWENFPKRLRAEWVCHDDAARRARTPALARSAILQLEAPSTGRCSSGGRRGRPRCRGARRAARDSVVRVQCAPGATPRGGRARPSWTAPRLPRAGRVLPARQAPGVRGFASRSSSWSYRGLCLLCCEIWAASTQLRCCFCFDLVGSGCFETWEQSSHRAPPAELCSSVKKRLRL